MRRAGYSPEVKIQQRESGDYRRGFADGWKTRTGRLHSVAKNKGMWWAGCIADERVTKDNLLVPGECVRLTCRQTSYFLAGNTCCKAVATQPFGCSTTCLMISVSKKSSLVPSLRFTASFSLASSSV